MKGNQGFTLIELVMVIVILGILSAFAIPKYADFSSDARVAALEGMLGAIKATSHRVRAECIVDSACDMTAWGPNQTVNGNQYCLLEGWFDAGTGGPLGASPIGSCGIDAHIDYSGFAAQIGGGGNGSTEHWFTIADAPDPQNCYAAYRQPDASGDRPEYRIEASGC